MKHIIRVLIKLFGVLSTLIFFAPKYMYENKKKQNRRIKGGAVLAVKHRSALDFVLMLHVFSGRYLRCVVGELVYQRNKFLRFLLNLFGSIKVDRASQNPRFIGECVDIASNGGVVEIYPEAHFAGSEILPFTASTVLIAVQAGVPVIPVYHDGNYGFFKRVTVVIGEPIYFPLSESGINPSAQELMEMTNILREKVIQLKEMTEKEH